MMRTSEGVTRLGSGLRALPQRLFFPPLTGGRSWLGKLRRTSFWRHQVKKRIAGLLRLLTDWALFILVVLTGGLISAYYMMDRGSSLSTINSGPWTMWTAAARTDADPYTVAHFARLGALPLPSEVGETWLARTDSAGSTLHSSCDYEIAVRPPEASWWSIAVFDADGRQIENAAGRYAYTSETGAISPDGRFLALLSRSAGGGNWLPTSGAGNLSVVYTLIDFSIATGTGQDAGNLESRVPLITVKSCR
jgi:hypothetical protein